jgi:betaine-aldehyde dehydrogenase
MPGQTALVANRVAQILAEIESLARGVVNIFTESGNTGAPYLVASPEVQVVSYTGSSAVGRMVASGGAPTLKRMNLELGGKTPMIVFDDADLDATIPLLAAGLTTFAGQFCMTGSRILVQRGVAHEVRTRLADILESVRVGNGLDPETDMGPLIDKATVARVDGMVEEALAYAKPIVRGGPVTDGALADGAFYRPALLEVEDVNTLPPTLLLVDEADVLRDEGEAYAAKLRLAGVPVTTVRYDGICHDFMTLNALSQTSATRAAIAQAIAFFRQAFDGASGGVAR